MAQIESQTKRYRSGQHSGEQRSNTNCTTIRILNHPKSKAIRILSICSLLFFAFAIEIVPLCLVYFLQQEKETKTSGFIWGFRFQNNFGILRQEWWSSSWNCPFSMRIWPSRILLAKLPWYWFVICLSTGWLVSHRISSLITCIVSWNSSQGFDTKPIGLDNLLCDMRLGLSLWICDLCTFMCRL